MISCCLILSFFQGDFIFYSYLYKFKLHTSFSGVKKVQFPIAEKVKKTIYNE